TDGFAMGTQADRFSYDGKVFSAVQGNIHFDVNADDDTGDVIVDVTGTLAYKQGQTKAGHWVIKQKRFSSDYDFFQGGVAVNVQMHGDSGQEAPFFPTLTGALATWGTADVYLDDQLFLSDMGIHTMYIHGMRNEKHQILKSPTECCYDT